MAAQFKSNVRLREEKGFGCLLDYLGLESVSVMAFSAGGTSALQFAQQYPNRVTSLIMVSAVSNVLP